MIKMHASALDTFQSPNGGSLGRVRRRARALSATRRPAPRADATRAAERVQLITATVAMDGSLLDAAVAAGADGIVVAATGAGNTDPSLLAAAVRAIERRDPGRACVSAVRRVGPGPAYAFPGGGAEWVRAGALPVGHLCAVKARVALALGLGAGLDRAGLAALLADPEDLTPCRSTCSSPADRDARRRRRVRLGRGRRHPGRAGRLRRVRGRRSRRAPTRSPSGSRSSPTRWRSRASPTRTSTSPARPTRRARSTCPMPPTLTRGSPGSAPRTRAAGDPDAWLEGHGWDVGPLGPLADRRRSRDGRAGPSRRVLGARPPRPARQSGGARDGRARPCDRRSRAAASSGATSDGAPEGVLYEAATRLVTRHVPPIIERPSSRAAIVAVVARAARARRRRRARPGRLVARTRTWTGRTRPTRACPSSSGCRSGCWPRSARRRASTRRSPAACAAARSSARTRAVVPGSAGRNASRTGRSDRGPRRCSPTSNRSPIGRSPPERRRGVWITEPDAAARAGRARGGRRHRDPDPRDRRRGGPGRARRARRRRPRRSPFMPKVEHVQLLDPADRRRGSPRPGSWRASSPPPRVAMPPRLDGCGAIGPSGAATPGVDRGDGAVLAFGTDAPVEPFDPWPGIALAVRREDRRWPAGTPPFAPGEALTLERALRAACVGPGRFRRASSIAAA